MTTETTSTAGTDTTQAATTTTAADGTTTQVTAPDTATTPATDTTSTDAAAAAAKAASDAETARVAANAAPETYADFKKPEGQELAPDVQAEVGALAKDLKLSQDSAQKVFDTAAKLASKATEAQIATIQTVQAGWKAEVLADKEVGGDKLAANLATAKAAMEATTTPQMRMLLERTGLGDNVEFIRHFLKIAPAFAEGKVVPSGTPPPGSERNLANILYPTMK